MLSVSNGSNVGTLFLREIWGLFCILAETDFIEFHSLHIEAAVPLICRGAEVPQLLCAGSLLQSKMQMLPKQWHIPRRSCHHSLLWVLLRLLVVTKCRACWV